MSDIEFADKEIWDISRRVVAFDARFQDSGDWITCAIGGDTLRDRFEARSQQERDMLKSFRKHRIRIQEIAARLIHSARYENDGTVLIRSEDT